MLIQLTYHFLILFSYREGEACNHIAALLYALVDITEKKRDGLHSSTSKECLWNRPRSRQLSPRKAEQLVFKKQKFSQTQARDSKPDQQKPTVTARKVDISRFGEKLKLCNPHAAFLLCNEETVDMFQQPLHRQKTNSSVRLGLPDPPYMYHDSVNLKSGECEATFQTFQESITLSENDVNYVESKTRKQQKSACWFVARKDRITASQFGEVIKRRDLNKPEGLIKSVLGYNKFTSESVRWGQSHEAAARRFYLNDVKGKHDGVTVTECGFITSINYPHLGASPDGIVVCPHCQDSGILEIKCPFKYRKVPPEEAAREKDFFCELVENKVTLKRNHSYYFQVQGQMALSGKKWCDFYVWTLAGRSVERIYFEEHVWLKMEMTLTSFFKSCVIPELFSRRVQRGRSLHLD